MSKIFSILFCFFTLAAINKSMHIVAWLKADFEVSHGHAMAIYELLKGVKKVGDK